MSPRAPAEGTNRAAPTPFLTKAYQLVDHPSNNDVISWSAGGTAFVVWRPDDFARDLLPHRFKHNNFSSFVRQLNTYGFKKISPNRWEFAHDLFRRGEQHLLCRIERRKATPVANRSSSPASSSEDQVRSSGSSPDPAEHTDSGMAELMEENEQLRRENKRLASEHAEMKNLCNAIRLLISGYNSVSQQSIASSGTEASLLFEQMAGDEAKDGRREGSRGDSPRLFRVQIGSKRSREEEELQLMPLETEAGSVSEGSICDSQEDENLVQLSLSHVSNRRFCSGLDRYFYPPRSESQGVCL